MERFYRVRPPERVPLGRALLHAALALAVGVLLSLAL